MIANRHVNGLRSASACDRIYVQSSGCRTLARFCQTNALADLFASIAEKIDGINQTFHHVMMPLLTADPAEL